MPDLGVYVNELATAGITPRAAESGIPYVVGTAPVHTAKRPAKPGVPVLCTGWTDAAERLGYSDDWEKYSLCEAMYNYFKLYNCQPVIFCNMLDVEKARQDAKTETYGVTNHRAVLPYEALLKGLTVKAGEGESAVPLAVDEDYAAFYDENAGECVVELLETGTAYEATSLAVEYAAIDSATVKAADIAEGISQVDACLNTVGVTPDLLLAPGWSHNPAIAALLGMKADSVSTLLKAKALVDIDCTSAGVTDPADLPAYKAKHGLTAPSQIACWPMAAKGGRRFHLSTQLAGLMATVDADNGGCPVESPANKPLKIDGCCLADGTEVNLTFEQVNQIAGHQGVVTALNFGLSGWVAKGNYMACYPQSADVKDQFIPVSRMFAYVGNTLVKTFWSKLDKGMKRRMVDDIVDAVNIWLLSQKGSEYILGGRIAYEAQENPLTDLLEGIIKFHIYFATPLPAQKIVFTLEFDLDYVTAALTA